MRAALSVTSASDVTQICSCVHSFSPSFHVSLWCRRVNRLLHVPSLPPSCRCISCQGHGFKTCSVCHGSQNLLHYIQLTVTWCVRDTHRYSDTWRAEVHHLFVYLCVCVCVCVCRKNNVDDFIPDRQPDFPDKKFEKVTGDPFFIDESVLVKTKNTSFILLSRRIRCATEASVHSVQFHSHEVRLQDRLSCQNRSSWWAERNSLDKLVFLCASKRLSARRVSVRTQKPA